jgi:nucleoside-diphosphate-sugar epimerase
LANVLVTGSAGYIGSVLVPAMARAGHTVVGYDLGWFGPDTQSRWWVKGDIRYPIIHPKWADVVVHLAGLSNDPMGELDPALTHEINQWGTREMIDHMPYARHVVISSCAVYGQSSELCVEESATNPQTTYAFAKERVDWTVTRAGVDHVILRLGTVYGPSPNHRIDLVVNRMVRDALDKGVVTATGNAARPLVHIEDVASAITWAVDADVNGIFNVVGENVRMVDLARAVAEATGTAAQVASGGADTRDYMASGSKILRAGWSPLRSVAGSLPYIIEHARETVGHVRLEQLRALTESGALDQQLRYAA